eukprot:scaffold3928_cov257-Pinguiococcus_pyrenoidosus.AAC.13
MRDRAGFTQARAFLQVLESEVHQMSWGGATVYIQQKITDRKAEDPEALEDDEQNGEVAAPEGDGDASSYA